ncbi:Myb/SANT-like DNA-binding domain-containing protein 3 [Folsomia candida]|uniref:Myb/SANT-like DNA-binding domain-containing protein 3 n=1 Tax=Folsomia candida TaxID=158441 RepID=A0A226CWU2_FOLCA|nr:Myb/SANT-like DNA-binding domain-containing protein 3 [Folsomia candida]
MRSDDESLSQVENVPLKGGKMQSRFTEFEKSLLLELISSKRNVLECKKSNPESVVKKQKAWTEVETEFNSSGNVVKRSCQQLKRAWENFKTQAKNEKAQAMSPLPNEFDSDCLYGEEQKKETSASKLPKILRSSEDVTDSNYEKERVRLVDKRSFKIKPEMEVFQNESQQKLKLIELQIASSNPVQQDSGGREDVLGKSGVGVVGADDQNGRNVQTL